MKIPRQKISASQGWQIMQVYLNLGKAPSAELAREYGVSPNYGQSLASQLGFHRPRKFDGGNSRTSSTVNHNDSRWKRAVAVGCVVA